MATREGRETALGSRFVRARETKAEETEDVRPPWISLTSENARDCLPLNAEQHDEVVCCKGHAASALAPVRYRRRVPGRPQGNELRLFLLLMSRSFAHPPAFPGVPGHPKLYNLRPSVSAPNDTQTENAIA